jgi:hypothetical protein
MRAAMFSAELNRSIRQAADSKCCVMSKSSSRQCFLDLRSSVMDVALTRRIANGGNCPSPARAGLGWHATRDADKQAPERIMM